MTQKKSVLIVDDNLDLQRIVSAMVDMCGHSANCAKNEAEMKKHLGNSKPHLIIMDIGLPGKDGLTLVSEIKAIDKFKDIPVIIVTAFADIDFVNLRSKAKSLGCNEFLEKPLNPDRMIEVLNQYLN